MKELKNVRADIFGLTKGISEGIEENRNGIDSLSSKLSNLVNPSLLINGNFLVNQRGVSSTSTAGYTVDRWKLISGTFTNKTDGCKLSSGAILTQGIENFSYNNTTFTASVSVNGEVFYGTKKVAFTSGSSSNQTMFENEKMIVLMKYDGTNMWFQITALQELNIEYAKLEFGEIATPYFFKTYDEELLNCSRFYYKIDAIWGRLLRNSTSAVLIVLPLKKMRITPSMSYADVYLQAYTYNSSTTTTYRTGFTYALHDCWSDCVRITATKNNHGILDGHYYFANLVFDAEM